MSESLEYVIEVGGEQEALSGFQRFEHGVDQALGKAAESISRSTTTAFRQMGQQLEEARSRTMGLTETLGRVSGVVGQIAGHLGGMNTAAGTAATALQTVLGGAQQLVAGGLNPVNIGITAVTTALSLGAIAFDSYTRRQRAAEEQARRLAQQFDQSAEGQLRFEVAQLTQEQRRLQSAGSNAEFSANEAYLRNAQQRLQALRAEREERERDARVRARLQEDEHSRNEENRRALEEVRFDEQQLAIQEADRAQRAALGRAAAAQRRTEEERAYREEQSNLDAFVRDEAALGQLRIQAEMEVERQRQQLRERAAQDERRLQEQAQQNAMQAMEAFRNAHTQSLQAVIDAADEANRALVGMNRDTLSSAQIWGQGMSAIGNEVAEAVGSTLTGALSESVDAWLSGSKSFGEAALGMARSVTKSLTEQGIIRAISETAEGLGQLALTWGVPNPGALLHFAAAGTWAAIAGVSGAVGAGIGAFGGGAQGAQAGAGSGSQRASGMQPVASQGNPNNVTIMVYAPNAIMTEAERGQLFARGVREARRVYGAGSVRMAA